MTLIELVVTIGIISILLVAGIPSYNHFANVNNLNQAVEDVKSAILDTQNFALSPQSNKDPKYDSYQVKLSDGSNNKFNIYQHNTTGSLPNTPVKEFTLLSGITFTTASEIIFSIANRGKIIDCPDKTITITNEKLTSDNSRTIKVNCLTAQMTVSSP